MGHQAKHCARRWREVTLSTLWRALAAAAKDEEDAAARAAEAQWRSWAVESLDKGAGATHRYSKLPIVCLPPSPPQSHVARDYDVRSPAAVVQDHGKTFPKRTALGTDSFHWLLLVSVGHGTAFVCWILRLEIAACISGLIWHIIVHLNPNFCGTGCIPIGVMTCRGVRAGLFMSWRRRSL